MKYLSKEPMVFGPPLIKSTETKPVVICDHKGTKKVYVHGHWECETCGAILIEL